MTLDILSRIIHSSLVPMCCMWLAAFLRSLLAESGCGRGVRAVNSVIDFAACCWSILNSKLSASGGGFQF